MENKLRIACKDGDLEKVKELLSKGADLSLRDGGGSNALELAAIHQHKNIKNFLLHKTALMFFSQYGHLKKVKNSLSRGDDVYEVDENGRSAFMLAAKNGHVEVLKELFKKDKRLLLKDKEGNIALDLAKDHLEAKKYLMLCIEVIKYPHEDIDISLLKMKQITRSCDTGTQTYRGLYNNEKVLSTFVEVKNESYQITFGEYIEKRVAKILRLNGLDLKNVLKVRRLLVPLNNHKNKLIVISEYFSGFPLNQYLEKLDQQGKLMPFDEQLQLMFAISLEVDRLHKNGTTVHNLRSDKILYDPETRGVKIIYGCSSSTYSNGDVTDANTKIIPWFTPESFGNKSSEKSDIFLLGSVFFNICTGKRPYWQCEHYHQTFLAFQNTKGIPEFPKNHGISLAVKKLMLACWIEKPENRPEISNVIKRLEDFIDIYNCKNIKPDYYLLSSDDEEELNYYDEESDNDEKGKEPLESSSEDDEESSSDDEFDIIKFVESLIHI